MSEFNEAENLGPLPKADRNSELELLSIKAFESALPADKFEFRRETVSDAGVDGSLELKIHSRYTNLRAQVQLKSTDSDKANADGSISIQVTAANLNYLLNGPSPLYVLYVAPRNELRFAWAREEHQRIEQVNPDWKQQDTVTIRFYSALTPEAIDQIHQHILDEEQMHRRINDTLSAASNTETLVIGISPENLSVTDPGEAKRILLSSGRLIVTTGHPEKIRMLVKILDPESERLPRILLVRAYAEHFQGRYRSAYALVSDAMLRYNELEEEDRQFLDFLRVSCEYLTGKLTLSEFSKRINERPAVEGHFAASYRINQIRTALFLTREPSQRETLLNEFGTLIDKVISDETASEVFKLYAKSTLLEAEGLDATTGITRELGEASIAQDLGRAPDMNGVIQKHMERLWRWANDVKEVIEEARKLGHLRILASAMLTKATVQFHNFVSIISLHSLVNLPPVNTPEPLVQENIDDIRSAVEIFSHVEDLEGVLRGKLLAADFYELLGQRDRAQEIALEVLPQAEAMGYVRQIEHAKDHLSGRGLLSRIRSSKISRTDEEKVIRNATLTDDEIREYAVQMLRILRLPSERLPVMEREYLSMRGIAREQLTWCRHIELLEDLRHTKHPSTEYRKDPDRVCICKLYQYKSVLEYPDWETVIAAFKRTYCEGCGGRSPLESDQSKGNSL